MKVDIPVLVVFYNRPNHLNKLINELKKYTFKKLYFYSDKPNLQSDKLKNDLCISNIKDQLDDKNYEIFISSKKVGTEAVMLGIDHVLKRESEIIVLEDDCIPKDYFFDFINKGRQYLSQSNICMLSTYVRNDIIKDLKISSVFESKIGNTWGWYTNSEHWWSFRYSNNKLTMLDTLKLLFLTIKLVIPISYTYGILRKSSYKNNWDYQWLSYRIMKNLSSIQPNIRLVDNIGFDESATHTNTKILKLETDNNLNMEGLKKNKYDLLFAIKTNFESIFKFKKKF